MGFSLGDLAGELADLGPLVLVAVVGVFLALARWRRHPAVSALLAGSLIAAAGSDVAIRLAFFEIVERAADRAEALIAAASILHTFAGTGAWAAAMVSAFGWRYRGTDAGRREWQFSLRTLMLLTLSVALLCGWARGLIWFFDWEPAASVFWFNLAHAAPLLVCWLIGAWFAIVRWTRHPPVSGLVLAAIAISFIVLAIWQMAIALLLESRWLDSGPTLIALQWLTAVGTPTSWAMLIAAALGWRNLPAVAGNHESPAALPAAEAAAASTMHLGMARSNRLLAPAGC